MKIKDNVDLKELKYVVHPKAILEDLIKFNKISKRKISKKTGFDVFYINSILKGEALFKIKFIEKLNEIFDTPINYIVRYQNAYIDGCKRLYYFEEIKE